MGLRSDGGAYDQALRAAMRAREPSLLIRTSRYCRDCEVRFACHGGCPKDRSQPPPRAASTISAPPTSCSSTTCGSRFGRWPSCSRAGRAPAEIMGFYEVTDARRGRNDPCTCGSGRKWKHCHGDARRDRARRPGAHDRGPRWTCTASSTSTRMSVPATRASESPSETVKVDAVDDVGDLHGGLLVVGWPKLSRRCAGTVWSACRFCALYGPTRRWTTDVAANRRV